MEKITKIINGSLYQNEWDSQGGQNNNSSYIAYGRKLISIDLFETELVEMLDRSVELSECQHFEFSDGIRVETKTRHW